MKKIFILLLSFSLVSLNSIFAQTMQASIGPGSTPTRVKLYMKALRPAPGVVAETLSTLDFNVGVKGSDYTIPPTMTVVSNAFSIAWTIEAPVLEAGFWNYHILKSVDINNFSFTTDLETQVMELELTGGSPAAISSPLNVSLVSQTDGGTTGALVFYCTGTINSDGSNLYYSRATDQGYMTTATNGFSYRPISVNSTLGTTPSTATILTGVVPVKFLGFNALKKDNNALITWQIENESSLTDRYEIERSFNGVDFKKISTIVPKNNGFSSNSYDLTDLNLTSLRSSGVFYYRIKQVDKDGHFVYSPIKSVRVNSKGMVIAVYPNPIKNYANISIDMEQDAVGIISFLDAVGKQVQNMQVPLFKGANIKNINITALSAGSYILKVQTPTEIMTIPVVKSN